VGQVHVSEKNHILVVTRFTEWINFCFHPKSILSTHGVVNLQFDREASRVVRLHLLHEGDRQHTIASTDARKFSRFLL